MPDLVTLLLITVSIESSLTFHDHLICARYQDRPSGTLALQRILSYLRVQAGAMTNQKTSYL